MTGNNNTKPTPKPVKLGEAMTTPSSDMTGAQCSIDFLPLPTFTVNIRSFHPNKLFEPGGLRFTGDERGFGLVKSGHESSRVDDVRVVKGKESRIYQRFKLDFSKERDLNIHSQTKGNAIKLVTASNTSENTHIIGQFTSDGEESYSDPKYQPTGTVRGAIIAPHGGQMVANLDTYYTGQNFAFVGSRTIKEITNHAPVPELEARMKLFISVERVCHYMDIAVLTYGDAFPNCEAFITDAAGQHLFLGTHVRVGSPVTHLPGANERLMFGHVLRVELDKKGNFGDKLWGFAHCLGGPPDKRSTYPAISTGEMLLSTIDKEQTYQGGHPLIPDAVASFFVWSDDYAKLGDGKSGTAAKPLHVSAYRPVIETWNKLKATFVKGPIERGLSRSGWNAMHEKRNPNEGRAPDDYDFKPKK